MALHCCVFLYYVNQSSFKTKDDYVLSIIQAGETGLMRASSSDYRDVVSVLLEAKLVKYGAAVDIRDKVYVISKLSGDK